MGARDDVENNDIHTKGHIINVPFVERNNDIMKRFLFTLFCFSWVSVHAVTLINSRCAVVDAIVAVVYGQEDCVVITQSDLERPGLGGQLRSLQDLLFEAMVYLDALKHKIIIDDEAIDKYLQMIMRENKVTREQIEQSFKDAGYTVEEGRDQLRMMQTVNTMINHRINRNFVIARKDVENYYATYPEYVSEEYTFEYAFVPDDGSSDQQERISKTLEDAGGQESFDWTKPFVIQGSEIAEEKAYLRSMFIGEISQPAKVEGGYELYHLIAKKEMRQKTLDERYHDIVEILRRPKMKELQDEYRAKLEKISSVVIIAK